MIPWIGITTVGSTQYFGMGFSGPVSGDGTIQTASSGNNSNGSSNNKLNLLSTANTFTGTLVNKGGSAIIATNSLGDGGKIQLYNNNNNNGGWAWHTGATAPVVFNTRQVELLGSPTAVYNNNGTAANTVTINTDLSIASTGNKTFNLRGSNTGDNTFGGIIADGSFSAATQVVTLRKDDGGKWILTGANTYTGNTDIINGTLEIGGAGQLGGGSYAGNITSTDTTPSPFIVNSSANNTFSGVISGSMALIKDGAGTLSLTGVNTYTGDTTVDGGTLSIGDGTDTSDLSDFGTLSVATGAVVDLNYSGSDTVLNLNIGGSPAAAGTWGATGSGATNINDTFFTGTGVINNLGGDTSALNIAYWDGGSVDMIGGGNTSSDGGTGTWDTTTKNWDIGTVDHAAWLNTTADEAVFGGSAGTVTVAEPVNLGDMTFDVTGNYTIDGGTLNFGAGATIRTADNRYWQTITSAITGSPAVETKDFGAGNQYKGFIFAPATGSQTLGAILNPNNTGNTDKAGVEFAGSTTGNSAASVDYAGGDRFADTVLRSGEWSIPGGIHTGTIKGFGGTFTLGGTVQSDYAGFKINGSTIKGDFTLFMNDRRESPFLAGASTIAPGNSVGTITVDYGTAGSNPTPTPNTQTNPSSGANGDYSFNLMAGTTYEWEIGAGGVGDTDKIHILEGALYVDDVTLVVVDAGGTPSASDQLPVFTYDPAGNKITMPDTATLNAEITIDISGTSYTGTPSLVNDGSGTIYLTGLSSGVATPPFDTWVGGTGTGFGFDEDKNGDGVDNGLAFLLGAANPDANATGLLPTPGDDGLGGLKMTFTMLDSASRGTAALSVQHSSDLGGTDAWAPVAPDPLALVPDTTSTVGGVDFVVSGSGTLTVEATIPAANASGGKLFGRLLATE